MFHERLYTAQGRLNGSGTNIHISTDMVRVILLAYDFCL